LDPIKRPWVFVDLARRFPHVEFAMLGRAHFAGPGSWLPARLPPNVAVLGHLDGESKRSVLGSAWMIVNTSIHESLPISFLEALHCGTPIVSCQDPEGVTSRFGRYVGHVDGSGLDALDVFADAIESLLDDDDLRLRLGAEGREWARANHTAERFLEVFEELATSLEE
jgi:glycosyltransferase involved in cell wall biosynthesis